MRYNVQYPKKNSMTIKFQVFFNFDAYFCSCRVMLKFHREAFFPLFWNKQQPFVTVQHVCLIKNCLSSSQLTLIRQFPVYCPYFMSEKWQRLYLTRRGTDTSRHLSARMAGKKHIFVLSTILKTLSDSTFWFKVSSQEISCRVCQ